METKKSDVKMTQIFEDNFPSLKGKATETNSPKFDAQAGWGYTEETIEAYCLDKQKAKDIINEHIDPLRFKKEIREFIARIKEELLWELDGKCPCIFHKPKFMSNKQELGL